MKILITGGASGIGKSFVEYLVHQHDLTVLDKDICDIQGVNSIPIELTSHAAVEAFFTHSHNTYDALINAAGIREILPPHELEIEEWEKVQKINVTVPFLLSKYLIKQALDKNKKLSIINIASVSGLMGEPNRAAYVASKHALIGLTKQLAFQYGKEGIRVNAIAPGIIETPLTQAYFNDSSMVNLIKQNTPIAHWGYPEHLHGLLEICLTNSYLTGSVLVCDGGWSCGKTL